MNTGPVRLISLLPLHPARDWRVLSEALAGGENVAAAAVASAAASSAGLDSYRWAYHDAAGETGGVDEANRSEFGEAVDMGPSWVSWLLPFAGRRAGPGLLAACTSWAEDDPAASPRGSSSGRLGEG